jgi:hypothetical protein
MINAFCFLISFDGTGRKGRSLRSISISKKSLKTIPETYSKADDTIRIAKTETFACKGGTTAKYPVKILDGAVNVLGNLTSSKYFLNTKSAPADSSY